MSLEGNKTLSIILLSYYSSKRMVGVYQGLSKTLNSANIPFELIIMDDGSEDDSYELALALEKENSNVFAYQLSKNYTSHYSIFAGLSVCKGACAIPIPDDNQQPFESIVKMYRLWEAGEKIIIPHREIRNDGWVISFFSHSFYQVMNLFSEVKFPQGGADVFFIDREVIDIINTTIHPIRTTSISEVLRLGFSPFYFPFERPKGDNTTSRWTLGKKMDLAKDFLFSSSTFPIKFISYTGVFIFIISLSLIVFYSYVKLFGNPAYWHLNEVPGWTSLIVFISFFSGLILLSIGIISEYIWRIYEEVKSRPGYIIKKK